MALLGQAALAMWWDVSEDVREEWQNWHTHEHFPERLSIPGFLRATRWTDAADGEGFFVMYELENHAVLSCAPYVARLNAPTPWSTRMMPLHRHMVRTQCQVLHSQGSLTARHALTLRCTPIPGRDQDLQRQLAEFAGAVSTKPGIVGMHVLRHQAPNMPATLEQKIRGNTDKDADWILVVTGYALNALRQLASDELSAPRLHAWGALPQTPCQYFSLACSALAADMR